MLLCPVGVRNGVILWCSDGSSNVNHISPGQGPYGEADSCFASQEIPRILWNSEGSFPIHSSLSHVSVSRDRWVQSMLSHSISLNSIPISSSHFPLSLSRNLFFFMIILHHSILFLHPCHMSRPSRPASLSRFNSVWWEVQSVKFLNT